MAQSSQSDSFCSSAELSQSKSQVDSQYMYIYSITLHDQGQYLQSPSIMCRPPLSSLPSEAVSWSASFCAVCHAVHMLEWSPVFDCLSLFSTSVCIRALEPQHLLSPQMTLPSFPLAFTKPRLAVCLMPCIPMPHPLSLALHVLSHWPSLPLLLLLMAGDALVMILAVTPTAAAAAADRQWLA